MNQRNIRFIREDYVGKVTHKYRYANIALHVLHIRKTKKQVLIITEPASLVLYASKLWFNGN